MPRREELNEEYLIRRVKETGGQVRKAKWVGRRGCPDRFIGWPLLGRSAWVEVKEESQPWGLQDHQQRELSFLARCGEHAWVLNSKLEIDDFITEMTR